jgi:hypothetical protein
LSELGNPAALAHTGRKSGTLAHLAKVLTAAFAGYFNRIHKLS